MSTKITVDNQAGTIKYVADPILPQIYDFAGEASGTPDPGSSIYNFPSGRTWTLKASGHIARCLTAPTQSTVFLIKKNGTQIGTITYTNSGVSGTVSLDSEGTVSFSIGDTLSITCPASTLNNIDTPYWVLLGTCP